MKKGINNSGFKALPSSVQNNILSNMKYGGKKYQYAAGGAMPMEQLTEFNEGGRHEENSLGGIPQGMAPDGRMNTVEEGETKLDSENYIYSDSLKIDKELAEAFNLSPKMVGKTFADASKAAGRKKSKREGDAIEMAANEKDLINLMEAQEAFKQARIEEKLQEISELDPNALPALMGQGQPQGGPQGDPAMGGQMQEAPMDEQAMMEQQMMAEQQGGGGQPSPEEMAMMQQQQDMAMGQQEGMMRNGGYTRSYASGGFFKGQNISDSDIYNTDPGFTKNVNTSDMYNTDSGFFNMGANPGMMNMANTGAMGMADPCPCGTPGCDPCAGEPNPTGITTQNMDRPQEIQKKGLDSNSKIGGMQFSPNLSSTEEAGFADDRVMQELRQHMLSNYGAAATSGDPAYGTGVSGSTDNDGGDGSSIGEGNDTGGYDSTGNVKDSSGELKMKGPRRGTKKPYNPERKWDGFKGNLQRIFTNKRYSGAWFPNRKIKGLEFGGNLMQPGNQMEAAGLNQMRSGGKMCYGCGGAMHNYGGRLNGVDTNPAKYGKFLDLYSNFLGAGASVLGNIPIVGQAVGAGLGTLSGVTKSFANKARASKDGRFTFKNMDYGDLGLEMGKGAAAGALGTAGSLAVNLGAQGIDAATNSKYEKQEAMYQDILANPEKYSEEQFEEALNRQNEMGKGSGAFKVINSAMNTAAGIAGGKIDAGNVAGDVAENTVAASSTLDPSAIMNTANKFTEATNAANSFGAKADNFADNKLVQQGADLVGGVLDKKDQTNAIESVDMVNNNPLDGAGYALGNGTQNESDEILPVNYENRTYRAGGKMIKRADGSYSQRGLWDNIRANKGSGKEPTKEMKKQEKKINSNALGGPLQQGNVNTDFNDGAPLTLMKQITQPDGTIINRSVSYNSMQEVLADKELVAKYGGEANVKELFSDRFKDVKTPYNNSLLENVAAPDPVYTTNTFDNRVLTEEEAALPGRRSYIEDLVQQQLQVNPEQLAEIKANQEVEELEEMDPILVNPNKEEGNEGGEGGEEDEKKKEEEEEETEEETEEEKKKEEEVVSTDDIKNTKFNFNYQEKFPEFAAKYAAPIYNIGSGLLSKQKDYTPDFVPLDVPKFDPTQALNNVKRQVSGIRSSLNKLNTNPANLLALAQSGSRLENETLLAYDKIQKQLDFKGNQYNTTQKQQMKKYQKQLEMSFDEAKRKSIQEGIKQMGEIQDAQNANFLAAQYNAMAAPNMGTFEYTPFIQGLMKKFEGRSKKNKNNPETE